MRRAVALVVCVMAAASAAGTSCIEVTYHPTDFLAYANALFYARAQRNGHFFEVERVMRGDVKPGARFEYPTDNDCLLPEDEQRYLVVLACYDGPCFLRWTKDSEGPRMLAFLKRSHRETHETVIAATLAWLRGTRSLDSFQHWIDTTAVIPRSEADDGLVHRLLEELRRMLRTAQRLESCDRSAVRELREQTLRPVAQILSTYPRADRDGYEYDLFEAFYQLREPLNVAWRVCPQR